MSGLDEVIVVHGKPGPRGRRRDLRDYRSQAIPDARLRLTQRVRQPHWFTTLPVVLMVGFLALIAVATVLLRRQMNQVAKARDGVAHRGRVAPVAGRVGTGGFARPRSAMAGCCLPTAPSARWWATRWRNCWHRTPHRSMRKCRSAAVAHPTQRVGHEARWRHRDGRIVDVMVFESPLVDGAGEQVGWMGSIVDVTERKRLEELERRQREVLANHARLVHAGRSGVHAGP